MGSTGEPDRKRRHFSSIPSPTAAMAKKQPFSHASEDKKLDTAVLQFQNQKLLQKLEAQKVEYSALESKVSQLKDKLQPYDLTLKTVNKSWGSLIDDLETCSNRTREMGRKQNSRKLSIVKDEGSSPLEDAFRSRLLETGATESSCANSCPDQMEVDSETNSEKIKNIISNILAAVNDLWNIKDGLHMAVVKELPVDDVSSQNTSVELETEVKNLRSALGDLHLNHKSLAWKLQNHQDIDAKNKAELKRLKGKVFFVFNQSTKKFCSFVGVFLLEGELDTAVAELKDSNNKLATLKAERDATKGAFFPVLSLGNKHVGGDKIKDKLKDVQEMESTLKELLDQSSSRLLELRDLHDERIKILKKLSNLQNSLKNVKSISSSKPFLLVRDQLEKSKSEVAQYRALFEKLQVEKDKLFWRERELNVKNDVLDVFRRSSAFLDSRVSDLEAEIQKQTKERSMVEAKLEEASREPGRKDIISEFKSLVSSFPEEMDSMQRQLSAYKETASNIHSLRAHVQSLSSILDRKAKECESLSSRSTSQVAEIEKLRSVVQYLKESDQELKLILEMYRRESVDSRNVLEARDLEYKAWAQVQSLKSSLDEQNLELRVKTANEAEAVSQQKLAAAEAEIVDLHQKLEASKRDMSKFSDVLKSKTEENEAYISEIETIGQAYDEMQTQNQHLLQQITERDDYNIKLVLEGARARQLRDSLEMEKQTTEKEIKQAKFSVNFYGTSAARIDEQLKVCSDQVHKLVEDKTHKSVALENTHKRMLDVTRSSNQVRESLEDSLSRVERSRATLLELQIELDRERFDKRRIEEDMEVARRKMSSLRAQTEGSSIVEKLQQELREYKEIVKCSICHDRPKEVNPTIIKVFGLWLHLFLVESCVIGTSGIMSYTMQILLFVRGSDICVDDSFSHQVVITKCYHLFCNSCVQRIIESRHRKCPVCSASFGHNDVKPVYI
ncbi:hypothetical protein Tsubulata_008249 [Turnera subulata]|uniref:E3 ubiquitin protein ligase n=1 Tax=Turnera subulata TaxID=218843 RepID=A0A9Q0FC57_9ROSI|nr:hypothetical protein Tsubulata_008249 [Turnera subulata]